MISHYYALNLFNATLTENSRNEHSCNQRKQ